MSRQSYALTDDLYQYMLEVSLREPEVLAKLRHYTANLPNAVMQISPEQGQFMGLLIQLIGAKKCLEIGVYTGYSALCVALNLPEAGQLIACDIDEQFTDIAQQYWQEAGVMEKITLKIAPALQTLAELQATGHNSTFDFAFIDADKPNTVAYYEASLNLLRIGGVMIIDNVFQYGAVLNSSTHKPGVKAMQELNSKIINDHRVHLSMLPVSDGITIIRKVK